MRVSFGFGLELGAGAQPDEIASKKKTPHQSRVAVRRFESGTIPTEAGLWLLSSSCRRTRR
jgi:hypothetical protein